MTKLSVVVSVLNEEKNIEKCLASVKEIADEIIIVDDGSTDKTLEIAKKYTSNIYHHKSKGYVEPTRNFGINKASGDWILLLDADEEIVSALADRIIDIVKKSEFDYIWIPRKNMIFGKWIQNEGWWPDYNVRLFRKGMVSWSDKIHSKPNLKGREIFVDAKEDLAIFHINYTTLSQFLEKLDRYTTIEANEYIKGGGIFKPKSLISEPAEEFLSRMFARDGFKDGYHGFLLSSLEGFSKQITMAKVWEKEGFKEFDTQTFIDDFGKESKSIKQKLRYWISSYLIKQTKNPFKKLIHRTIRKISTESK